MSYYYGNDVELGTLVGSDSPIKLDRRDRARHTYMVGASRTGKTKLMEGICRQDLLKWADDHCPMVVIDPADTLFDGLMGYAAAEGLDEWPIIPFDLRRDDLIVSYDLLKERKGVRPAVICRAFVEAIVHAWGQTNTHETPLLASMLESVLMVAIEKECTISQSLQMILNPTTRQMLLTQVQHTVARATLTNAHLRGEKGFQENVQSTMLRINTFLSNIIIEATLCTRTGWSLDLAEVLEKGKILLVCLSINKANISPSDSAAIGSVLLTDLWTAAKRRGKAEEGERIPCYVHIDEFQNFLTPDIAIGLTEASGFGLHLTLAHQYPSQLPDRGGELGQMILNAVLATAKNKFAFQLEHPTDLDMLARVIGRQMVDLDKVKREIWQTKVMGYKLAYLRSFSMSDADGDTHSVAEGENYQVAHASTVNWSDTTTDTAVKTATVSQTEKDGVASGANQGIAVGRGDTVGHANNRSRSTVDTQTDTEAEQWNAGNSKSDGGSSTTGNNRSESLRFGPPTERGQNEIEAYKEGQFGHEVAEKFKRERAVDYTLAEGTSDNETNTWANQAMASAGGSKTLGYARADGTAEGEVDTESQTQQLTHTGGTSNSATHEASRGTSGSTALGTAAAHSEGGAETDTESFGTSKVTTDSKSKQHTEGVALIPTLLPIMGKELSSQESESRDDQLFRITQFLDAQPDRHCMVRLASDRMPQRLFTATIELALTSKEARDRWVTRRLKRQPFVLTAEDAYRQIDEGKAKFANGVVRPRAGDEPNKSVRNIR